VSRAPIIRGAYGETSSVFCFFYIFLACTCCDETPENDIYVATVVPTRRTTHYLHFNNVFIVVRNSIRFQHGLNIYTIDRVSEKLSFRFGQKDNNCSLRSASRTLQVVVCLLCTLSLSYLFCECKIETANIKNVTKIFFIKLDTYQVSVLSSIRYYVRIDFQINILRARTMYTSYILIHTHIHVY